MISKKDDRSLEEKQVRREGREDLIARVSGVSFAYPDDPARPVLRGLDLEIVRGECLAVLGDDALKAALRPPHADGGDHPLRGRAPGRPPQ